MSNSIDTISIVSKEANLHVNLLYNIITNQTSKNIIEWIINSDNDLNTLSNEYSFEIIKNDNNTIPRGNYVLYMNLNEYYSNDHVESIVKLLKYNSKVFTNKIYLYDFLSTSLYSIDINNRLLGENKNNSNNNTTIFENSILQFNYSDNYNREILLGSVYTDKIKNINKLDNDTLEYLIDNDIFNKYNSLYNYEINNEKYIVYLTGGFGCKWDPEDKNLGGSEHAIVELVNCWVKDYPVRVYGNFITEKTVNGIEYKHWYNYPFYSSSKLCVIWRKIGMVLLNYFNIKSSRILLDLHDNPYLTLSDLSTSFLNNVFNKITNVMVKSNYHDRVLSNFLKDKNVNIYKNVIVPNGVRISKFTITNTSLIPRNKYRFCYCSSYDRGLDSIVLYLWNRIFKLEPLCELHVYYGMDYIYDDNFKKQMQYILGSKGVIDHGRQSLEYIIKEKYLSNFHLYPTDTISETDCINVKESLVAGCIPIISNFNVFSERDGFKIDWSNRLVIDNKNNDEFFDNAANKIVELMYNDKECNELRSKLYDSNTIISWEKISKLWF